MSERKTMRINPLPASTWNWLHMNEAEAGCLENPQAFVPEAEKPEGIRQETWEEKQTEGGCFSAAEGGMGDEFEKAVRGSGAAPLVFRSKAQKDSEVRGQDAERKDSENRTVPVRKTERKNTGGTASITEEPVRLHFDFSGEGDRISRIGLHAEEGSSLFVIMDFAAEEDSERTGADLEEENGSGSGIGQKERGPAPDVQEPSGENRSSAAPRALKQGKAAVQTKIRAEKDSRVKLVQIQHFGAEKIFYNDVGAFCGENAQVELIQLVLGGAQTYIGGRAALAGDGSRFRSSLGYLLSGKDRLDINYDAVHTGRKTDSVMSAGGVLRDEAFKLFRGTIDFRKGSAGATGDEKEDALLLSDGVVNQTIPLILCEEEDVEGGHGATIGRVDDELLFYLESRGIAEEAVYEMLARARIEAVGKQIKDARAEELVEQCLEAE